jgi:hypothetical protein
VQIVIQAAGYVVGLSLELLIVAALLQGGYKQYPFVFAYIVADLITTVIEIQPSLVYASRTRSAIHDFLQVYWIDERVMQTLMFMVVISLVYMAVRDRKPQSTAMSAMIGGTLLFAGISFLIHYRPERYIGQWMTPWTRDLNFGGAILDFALWLTLIAQPRRNHRLLMLSGALGIQFTGQAIGHSIRTVTHMQSLRLLANVLLMVLNLVFLYLWWQALRPVARTAARDAGDNESPVPPRRDRTSA